MSIYASTLLLDGDDHRQGCASLTWDTDVAERTGKPCDCPARYDMPIPYRGSHVYPEPEERGGAFDLGVIPGHIAEGGGYADEHEHWAIACHRPFLRVGFLDTFGNEPPERGAKPTSGTIILDVDQVRRLRDELTDFLERITGEWCLAAESREQAEAGLRAFIDQAKADR